MGQILKAQPKQKYLIVCLFKVATLEAYAKICSRSVSQTINAVINNKCEMKLKKLTAFTRLHRADNSGVVTNGAT